MSGTKANAPQRYAQFIREYNGKEICLMDKLERHQMSRTRHEWVKSGVATWVHRGYYRIESAQPMSDAKKVLKIQYVMKNASKKIKQTDLFQQPKTEIKPKAETKPKPEKPTRRKRISIMWGLITIES